MDCRQFNESQDFSSYDYPMYQLDPYNSGSSVASSPHLCSPSPQYLDFDLSYGPFDFMAFSAMEPGECSQSNETPIGIAPQELHSPGFLQHSLLLSGEEETTRTQERFATPRAVVDPTLPAIPEPQQSQVLPPNAFPMKKDRARGSANLYRSVSISVAFSLLQLTDSTWGSQRTPSARMGALCAFASSNGVLTLPATLNATRGSVLTSALQNRVHCRLRKGSSSGLMLARDTGRRIHHVKPSFT